MKTLLAGPLAALLLVSSSFLDARAQDSSGRERRPPDTAGSSASSGGSDGSGAVPRDSGSSSSSGGSSDSGSSGGGGYYGGGGGGVDIPWIPRRPDASRTAVRSEGEARSRPRPSAPAEVDAPKISAAALDARKHVREFSYSRRPDAPTQGPKGEALGKAVLRSSFSNTARRREIEAQPAFEETGWRDFGNGRCYHQRDWSGDNYYWYFGDEYYVTRWRGGRHWFYDESGRWCAPGGDDALCTDGYYEYLHRGGRTYRVSDHNGGVSVMPEGPSSPIGEGYRVFSPDGKRLVRVDDQRNAFLYDLTETPAFAPFFLAAEVDTVVWRGAEFELRQDFTDKAVTRRYSRDGAEQGRPAVMKYAMGAPAHALRVSLGSTRMGIGGDGSVLKGNSEFLDFDQTGLKQPNRVEVEYLKGAGHYFEFGLSVGGRDTAALPSRYRDWVHPDQSDVKQELTVSNRSVQGTMRWFPGGRDRVVQPYVGVGMSRNSWSYQEKGEFVDFAAKGYPFYNETYAAKGSANGVVALAGVRVPLNGRVALEGEWRKNWAKGTLPEEDGFAGNRVDLSGSRLQAGVTLNLSRPKKRK